MTYTEQDLRKAFIAGQNSMQDGAGKNEISIMLYPQYFREWLNEYHFKAPETNQMSGTDYKSQLAEEGEG